MNWHKQIYRPRVYICAENCMVNRDALSEWHSSTVVRDGESIAMQPFGKNREPNKSNMERNAMKRTSGKSM